MSEAPSPVKLTCHQCGALYQRAPLAPNQWARCRRCDGLLETYSLFTPMAWIAVVIATLIVLTLAYSFPVATLFVQGSAQSSNFLHAVLVTWEAGYPEVAVLTFLVGFLLPVLHLFLLLWLFVPLTLGRLPRLFEPALSLLDHLKPWCMVPVFLLGALVAIVKLVDLASLTPGIGLFATIAAAVLITALTRLSGRKIRHMAIDMGINVPAVTPPPPPSPAAINKTWALLFGAVFLYFPANLLPVMSISALGSDSRLTIMGGVIELWGMGSWDIALVVFIASVFVPSFKILLLATLVYLTQIKSTQDLKRRTKLYHLVEFIGQWSMLDVFVVILLAGLGKFGSLLDIEPGPGAAAFGGVVVLTMLAALNFDPRLAWRSAGHRRHTAWRHP